ncbi:MAG: MBL fold metallo-hydrolase RNA specificity domain-containing protein [Candidatus Anstonellales archaeon]
MLDQSKRQIKIGEVVLALDADGGDVTFISHAHSDHACYEKSAKKVVASAETLKLIGSSKQNVAIEGANLLEAGHMLGSRQISLEVDGGVFVYTGDFKIEHGLTTGGADIPSECDYLMIEGTYGEPGAVFPPREDVFLEMEKWLSKNKDNIVLIGAYEIGKAQEVVKFLNKYCSIEPIVTKKIDFFCRVYEEFGHRFKRVVAPSKEADEMYKDAFVSVLPMEQASFNLASKLSYIYGKKTLCTRVTGWAYKRTKNADRVFCLSDHADFPGILKYVEAANPRRVYCVHGNEEILANELRKRGVDALAIPKFGAKKRVVQSTLEVYNALTRTNI